MPYKSALQHKWLKEADELKKRTQNYGDFKRGDELGILDYFEKSQGNSWMFDNAQKRVFRHLIARPGIIRFNHETFPKRARAVALPKDGELYLPRLFLDDFYDMEYVLDSLVRFLLNGARGGEALRQMFALWGPPGVAKSQLVDFMRARMSGAPIFHLKDCPVRDSPLLLIPKHSRSYFSRELGVHIPENEDICVCCRHRLLEEHGGEWQNFPVQYDTISSRRNVGSASVAPFDPNTTGSEVLIGDEMFWLPPDTPLWQRLRFAVGAFAQACGGILEFREILKAVPEVRNLLLIATQDRQFPTPNYYEWVTSNFVVLIHANMPEVVRWRTNSENKAFFDRIETALMPYVLSWSGEKKIYEKMLSRGRMPKNGNGLEELNGKEEESLVRVPERLIDGKNKDDDLHKSPHAVVFAAQFAVASRFERKKAGEDWKGSELRKILSTLNGDADPAEIASHLREHLKEGFDGLSTRFVIKAIEDARAQALLRFQPAENAADDRLQIRPCAGFRDVKTALERRIKTEIVLSHLSDGRKESAWWQEMLERINGERGSFTHAFLRGLKRIIYEELWDKGVVLNVVGADYFQKAVLETKDKYLVGLLLFQGDPADFDRASVDFMQKVEQEAGIENTQSQREFRDKLWKEMKEREKCRDAGVVASREFYELFERGAEKAVRFEQRDEFLGFVASRLREMIKNGANLKESSFSRLSEYCPVCLLEILEIVCSPFIPGDANE